MVENAISDHYAYMDLLDVPFQYHGGGPPFAVITASSLLGRPSTRF